MLKSGFSEPYSIFVRGSESIALFLFMLFCWQRAHLQYLDYSESSVLFFIYRCSLVSVFFWIAIAIRTKFPQMLLQLMTLFITLILVHFFFDRLTGGSPSLRLAIESMMVAIAVMPIIADGSLLKNFFFISFVFGLSLILLNSLTVFHWLEWIDLSNRQVPRHASATDISFLDPIYFGLFGLTENIAYPNHPLSIPRIQGFSLEPIHWAYFVFITVSMASLWLSLVRISFKPYVFGLVLSITLTHLFFVFSSTAFIALIFSIGTWLFFLTTRTKMSAIVRSWTYWLVVVLLPGLLIPFALTKSDEIVRFFRTDQFANQLKDLVSRFDYLRLDDSIFLRLVPYVRDVPAAAQNFILGTYLKFGYFLILPEIIFLFWFIRNVVVDLRATALLGGLIALSAHLMLVPGQFFYPSAAIWFLLVAGVAHHQSGEIRNPS